MSPPQAAERRLPAIVWRSVVRTNSAVLAVLGVVVSFLTWQYESTMQVPLLALVVVGFLALIAVIVLIDALLETHKLAARGLPAVLEVKSPAPANAPGAALLLLDPSDVYQTGMSVTIHVVENLFERCVGVGRVSAIQADGRIQVLVLTMYGEAASEVEGLRKNLRSVLVKPHLNDADVTELVARYD